MKKLIFLDIDGVLAVPVESHAWGLSDELQTRLGEILNTTGAMIVMSSSWRKETVHDTKLYMASRGFQFCDKIIGVTIRAYHYLERGAGVHLSIPRGVEIKQWIDTNIHSNMGKDWKKLDLGVDFNYVILDDDTDMLLEQKSKYINVDGILGLTAANATMAIKILNESNKNLLKI